MLSASYTIGYGLAAVPAGAIVSVVGARGVALGGLTPIGASCGVFAVGDRVVVLDAARVVTGAGAAAVWAGSIRGWSRSASRGIARG